MVQPYYLHTVSALPFGTFGEMLGADNTPPVPGQFCGEDCANKWRGMLFGMSNRAGWNGQDPNHNAELWQVWDAFEIEKANMFGWWNESSPVQVEQQGGRRNRDGDDEGVFATAYAAITP